MDKDIKVSVIIPVYKAEKYLARTIDSLLKQTLEDVEIVCVNDGSPDNSLSIIEEYSSKNSNIVVLDKKNEGVYRARLDGVKKARGKYISFIDADDYVTEDFLEKLYKTAESNGAEIAVCGFQRIDNSTGHVYSTEMCKFGNSVIDVKTNPEKLLEVNGALWNKLYDAKLFDYAEQLESRPRAVEDAMLLMMLYQGAKKVAFFPEPLYSYMIIEGSAMSSLKISDVKVIGDALCELKAIYEKNNVSDKLFDLLHGMVFIHYAVSITLRRYMAKEKGFGDEVRATRKYLKANFPEWRRAKCLSMWRALTKGGNFKSAIMKKIYVFRMFRPFLFVYVTLTKKLKIDIKW